MCLFNIGINMWKLSRRLLKMSLGTPKHLTTVCIYNSLHVRRAWEFALLQSWAIFIFQSKGAFDWEIWISDFEVQISPKNLLNPKMDFNKQNPLSVALT